MKKQRQLTYLIILIGCFLCYQGYAQEQEEPLVLRVGAFTESGTHPGLMIGAMKTIKSWESLKVTSKKETPKIKSLVFMPQLGTYVHAQNHTGMLAHLGLGLRRQKKEKSHYHLGSIGVGSLTQFNKGTTYILGDDGEVDEKKLGSRTYFHTSLAYELGQAKDKRLNYYLRLQIGAKFPYNTYFSLVPIIQVGFNYQISKSTENAE